MDQLAQRLSHAIRPVVLAHESDFQLGEMTVRPSSLQVECRGECERVEPRVMKVLVALSLAGGSVVTRDELVDQCWDGRIVGEDAIQRVLGRIRGLARDVAKGSFRLETVRGVGCRLVAPQFGNDGPQSTTSSSVKHRLRSRSSILVAAAAAAIFAGAGLYVESGSGPQQEAVRIAVLPFKSMSADHHYFAEGFAEEVANKLAREPQFKVAGRTSSELFAEAADLREVGRRLHVSYVLEGSVRSAGEKVQVDVSLVEASKGMRLWSQNFRGSLDDVFAIQDAIGEQVAVRVRRQLTRAPAPRGTTTTRGDVYSLFLAARGLIGSREPAKLHSAVELLRQAVKLDPDYAPAWAHLAQAMRLEWQRSRPDREELDSARQQWLRIAQHALKLAPESADSHLAMCHVLSSFVGETTKYERLGNYHCERAAQLDPHSGEVWDAIAQQREFEGNFPGALEAYRRLHSMEPLWWHAYGGLARLSWKMGYRDEARRVIDRTVRDADPFAGDLARAYLALEQGDWSDSLRLLDSAKAAAKPSEKEVVSVRMAIALRSLGRFAEARHRFPYYDVDEDMWLMWNGKAPSPRRVAELGSSPVKLWHSTKAYFLVRTLLSEERSGEVVQLYDRRFRSPDELHATLHQASPELVLALRDVGRRAEANRMAELGEADARRIQSHGRVPFGFYYNRSLMLAAQGRQQEAINSLEKAVKLGWFYNNEIYSFRDIGQEPVFREIALDPRFQRIRGHFAAHRAREAHEIRVARL